MADLETSSANTIVKDVNRTTDVAGESTAEAGIDNGVEGAAKDNTISAVGNGGSTGTTPSSDDILDKPVTSAVDSSMQLKTVADSAANGELIAPGQQYYVVVTQDQNGKVLGAVQQGAALQTGTLPASNLLKPAPPVTIKRGAAKNIAKAATTVAITPAGVTPTPAAAVTTPRPLLSNITATQGGQALRLIPFTSAMGSLSGTGTQTLVFTSPSGASTTVSAISSPTTAIKKPTSPVVSKVVPATGTVMTKSILTKPAAPITVLQPAVKKPQVIMKPVTTTKVPMPPAASSKFGKPIAATDKMVQQKRLLGESIVKLRKIERVMVQAKPDQATPFTYGEIFQQAAVSFSKMAALTTHISLESQTPTDQRRWSPDLINKFVSSINVFASSMKEVGDELKKRHEQQLMTNLKRKADTELLNAKKPAVTTSPISPVVASSQSTVTTPLTDETSTAVSSDSISQISATDDTGPTAVKHPLEISTAQAISTLMSSAKTNGVDSAAALKDAEPMEVTSNEPTNSVSAPTNNETVAAQSETAPISDQAGTDAEPHSESHGGLTNGFGDAAAKPEPESVEAALLDIVMEDVSTAQAVS